MLLFCSSAEDLFAEHFVEQALLALENANLKCCQKIDMQHHVLRSMREKHEYVLLFCSSAEDLFAEHLVEQALLALGNADLKCCQKIDMQQHPL